MPKVRCWNCGDLNEVNSWSDLWNYGGRQHARVICPNCGHVEYHSLYSVKEMEEKETRTRDYLFYDEPLTEKRLISENKILKTISSFLIVSGYIGFLIVFPYAAIMLFIYKQTMEYLFFQGYIFHLVLGSAFLIMTGFFVFDESQHYEEVEI